MSASPDGGIVSDAADAASRLSQAAADDAAAMDLAAEEAAKRLNYKLLKESFVSNLTGSSIGDINMVTLASPMAGSLWAVLQSRQSFFEPYGLVPALADYMINIGTLLLSVTLYADQSLLLNLAILVPVILLLLVPPVKSSHKAPRPSSAALKKTGLKDASAPPKAAPAGLGLKPFLTMYRGSMMVMTMIAILAVDFRLFPRRFAKVETWGTSLMDLGVGSFVFSAGVVGARPLLKERQSGTATPVASRVLASLRHSLPLLVLGVIRMLSVKGLEYAEHTTEYGVHWNFFFTLGLLPPFVAASAAVYAVVPSFSAQALLIAGAYQAALSTTALQNYIIMAERTTLLSQNREGVFSFLGYLAIFLAGQDAGMWMLPRIVPGSASSTSPRAQRVVLLRRMAAWTAAWTALYVAATHYRVAGLVVSRRMANLPYVLWTAAFNGAQIMACCVVETVFFPGVVTAAVSGDARAEKEAHDAATSRLYRAINRNGLALFLLANVLTGLVNLTVPTLEASDGVAMGILVVYTGVISAVALALDYYNVSIKL